MLKKYIEKFNKHIIVNFLAITVTIIVGLFPNINIFFKFGVLLVAILVCFEKQLKFFIKKIYNFFSIKITSTLIVGLILGLIFSYTLFYQYLILL